MANPFVHVELQTTDIKKARVTPVGDMGKMSIIVDPTGATLGLWQSNPKR
jgi:predicted enzyme related to lactoylglutathione lyase